MFRVWIHCVVLGEGEQLDEEKDEPDARERLKQAQQRELGLGSWREGVGSPPAEMGLPQGAGAGRVLSAVPGANALRTSQLSTFPSQDGTS